MLAYFRVIINVLKNQKRNLLRAFEDLCTITLIDHCIIVKNHLDTNSLAEWIVQIVKHDLQKYELFCSNHQDSNLILPWIIMSYHFSKQTSLSSYNLY